ncbi:MAG TPA: HAMP domain-containing sensor histidine kinase [Gemmatimonadales bacterium]|nr:HAMP domain-containing sensor histidine kinase [Gemmatimonadales bacterium]
MPLPFRRRIFFVLVAMAAAPTGLAVVGWVLTVRTVAPMSGARASLEEVASSARVMLEQVDTNRLAPAARAAMRDHINALSRGVSLARRADRYLRYYTAGLAAVVVALGTLVLFAAVRVAGHLSRQLSRPIDELVGWTRLIRQHEALPQGAPTRGAPEFESLRLALRDLAGALDAARARELESERLRAFREVARRVAHEIKNPLTAMRIAVEQLGRPSQGPDQRRALALEVLAAETDRLEHLAREFADFGRLPEGPTSEVDLVELLEELGRTAVSEQVAVVVHANGAGRRSIQGHYDPLRRAFSNLFRNAAEAMGGCGRIDVRVAGEGRGMVVTVADHGPGILPALRGRVFEPYMTTKVDGTGLGLALVRQTVDAHGGTIAASETPGGGATFTLVFPT